MSGLHALILAAEATVELTENGERVAAPMPIGGWEERSGGLFAAVKFGPYPGRVSADAVTVRFNGDPEVVPLPGRISLPAGTRFTYELIVGATRDA